MAEDVDERLSRRFQQDEETDAQNDENAQTSQKAQKSETAQRAQNDGPADSQNDMTSSHPQADMNVQTSQKAQNIKKEWNVRSFYLDDDLHERVSTAFKRLDLELTEADTDIDLKKTRHFYPLLVELGLERLESMDSTEVTEALERD